jgi:molybdate transport system regulatory protein
MKPQAHIRIDFSGTCSIGPGKIGLLEGIERTGSLSAAARAAGMSYRRAWLLLHSTNEGFSEPVVELSVGGKDGGGTRLTDFGRQLVANYRRFDAAVEQLAAKAFADVRVSAGSLEADAGPRAAGARRPVNRALGARSRSSQA